MSHNIFESHTLSGYIETATFNVSIESKQTEDQLKQFDREHILVFFRKLGVVSVCFGLFRNSSVCFRCFDIKVRNTETNRSDILR
jgi:hypothetical protein